MSDRAAAKSGAAMHCMAPVSQQTMWAELDLLESETAEHVSSTRIAVRGHMGEICPLLIYDGANSILQPFSPCNEIAL